MNRAVLVAALSLACLCAAGRGSFSAEFLMDRVIQERLAGIRAQSVQIRGNLGTARYVLTAESKPRSSMDQYPVLGIDISHYQEEIQWDKVKKHGVSFVYMKATEGGDFVDHLFQQNWKGASGAGLTKGAYHFWNFCKGGAEQAKNFIRTVPNEKDSMPAAIDLERSGSCSAQPPKDKLRKELDIFMSQVKGVYGKTPVIYLTYEIYNLYFTGDSDGFRIWIRDIRGTPKLPDDRGWMFWQYSDKGEVVGIGKPVDLDAFNGNEQQFQSFMRPDDPPEFHGPFLQR